MTRHRHFCLTLNNYTGPEFIVWKNFTDCEYFVFQAEKAENNGTPHLQGYIEFAHAKKMKHVKAYLGKRVHVEVRRGSKDQARSYCMKLTTRDAQILKEPHEFGTYEPAVGQGHRTDFDDFRMNVLGGTSETILFENHTGLMLRYRHMYSDTIRLTTVRPPGFISVDVQVLWGEPGTGKTRFCYETWDLFRPMQQGNVVWWDGYAGQDTILIDDFYGQLFTFGYLLQLVDGYPIRVPIKGTSVVPNLRRIVFTSNLHWKDWYPNVSTERKEALARRIKKVVHFTKTGRVPENIFLK